MYGGICHAIAIEHIVRIQSGIDYDTVVKDKDVSFTQCGLNPSEVQICGQPFFTLRINTDGIITPCYS